MFSSISTYEDCIRRLDIEVCIINLERLNDMENNLDMTRHLIASIAYRFNVAVNEAPEGFGEYDVGNGGWTPSEIVRHMTQVVRYAQFALDSEPYSKALNPMDFEEECDRFIQHLRTLDRTYYSSESISLDSLKKIIQGPLADITTHIGQIAMVRRRAGAPVEGENYMKANIEAGMF